MTSNVYESDPFVSSNEAADFILPYIGKATLELVKDEYTDTPYRVDILPIEKIKALFDLINHEKMLTNSNQGLWSVRIDSNSAFADIARHVEASVFKDSWYKDMSPEDFSLEMEEEYGPYEEGSHFVLLVDTESLDENNLPKLVGMGRAVGGDSGKLKTINDMQKVWGFNKEDILKDISKCIEGGESYCEGASVGDPTTTWDYSSLAVVEEYRHSDAYSIISSELYHMSIQNGINTVITVLVDHFLRLYKLRGVPFRSICNAPSLEHMGAASPPAVWHLNETHKMLTGNHRAVEAYNQMVLGHGLEFGKLSV